MTKLKALLAAGAMALSLGLISAGPSAAGLPLEQGECYLMSNGNYWNVPPYNDFREGIEHHSCFPGYIFMGNF